MVKCPKCGHQNLPSFTTCSHCSTALPALKAAAPQPKGPETADEFARLMAARQARQRRNRKIYAAVAIVLLGFGTWRMMLERANKAKAQDKLDYAGQWAEMEKRETGSFWACVMASEVDVGMFANANQIQQRIESAYFTQQKTFSDYLTGECVPKIERARQAFGGLRDAPPELAGPIDKYRSTLPKLQSGIEEYADKIKGRQGVKDVDQLIQEHGNAWHGGGAAGNKAPEAIAYEKFVHCAVPGLAKMKDAQEMLEFLADQCFKQDPVKFMDRVRNECGPILTNVDPQAKPSATWKLSLKKLYEEEARQLQAWESCGRKSRKGKKVDDLATFLVVVGEYMSARSGVVNAAREIQNAAK